MHRVIATKRLGTEVGRIVVSAKSSQENNEDLALCVDLKPRTHEHRFRQQLAHKPVLRYPT